MFCVPQLFNNNFNKRQNISVWFAPKANSLQSTKKLSTCRVVQLEHDLLGLTPFRLVCFSVLSKVC